MEVVQLRTKVSTVLQANFSERFYRRHYASYEVQAKGAVEHYIRVGEEAGAMPTPYFNPNWWKATHGLERGGFSTVFENFLTNHQDQAPSEEHRFIKEACFSDDNIFKTTLLENGRSRNGLIDFEFIRKQNSCNIVAPDPICLYLRLSGEGFAISPSRFFDPAYYKSTNDDVARDGSDPFVHFLKNGIFENRKPSAFIKLRGDFSRYSDRLAFLRGVYSPSELFEMEPPYELIRGDFSSIGKTTRPNLPSNLFFGEPHLRDGDDFDLMYDVYRSFMESYR